MLRQGLLEFLAGMVNAFADVLRGPIADARNLFDCKALQAIEDEGLPVLRTHLVQHDVELGDHFFAGKYFFRGPRAAVGNDALFRQGIVRLVVLQHIFVAAGYVLYAGWCIQRYARRIGIGLG